MPWMGYKITIPVFERAKIWIIFKYLIIVQFLGKFQPRGTPL
jgi:hypothetical protein